MAAAVDHAAQANRRAYRWLTADGVAIALILLLIVMSVTTLLLRQFIPAISATNAATHRLVCDLAAVERLQIEHGVPRGASRAAAAADGGCDRPWATRAIASSVKADTLRSLIPNVVQEQLNIGLRLFDTSVNIRQNAAAKKQLAVLDEQVWTRRLSAAIDGETSHWKRLAKDLCEANIAAPPQEPRNPDRVDLMQHLAVVQDYRAYIWDIYERCQEPRTVIVDEDLLRFQVDQHAKFHGDPTPAYRSIAREVTANVGTHPRIYVFGHTDDTGSFDHNNLLSFRRALHVAQRVRVQLQGQGMEEPRDFEVHPVGMGEYQPVQKQRGWSTDEHRKESRRIELSFRARSRGPR